MKRILLFIILATLISESLSAQSVGLVLSGGGAKGIAHIGLIKALEENNIPIDYVAGTSMGAIVSALYAVGMSPDEMIELIKSDNFKSWQTGKVDARDMFYFKQYDPTPEFGHFKIDVKDTTKTKTTFLPVSLVNPIQMNLGFIELFAKPTALSGGDFDRLMVPFRCIASDVYNKQAVVFRKGNLGNSVRASMTIPFVFKPIEIDGNLLYDGGIYNNFPADVMLSDFNPDYMIGSVVVENPNKPKENDIMSQMENMVMQKTNYNIEKNRGVTIQFKLDDVGLLDFDKVDYLYELGYKKGLEYIKELKQRINRQVTPENMALRRFIFKSKQPDLVFKKISVSGVSKNQEAYILSQIKKNERGEISFKDFRKTYFKLLSDKKIEEINPELTYDHESGYFNLNLKVKLNENLSVAIGGLISSISSNHAYLGLKYQTLRFYSLDLNADAQIGDTYNAFQLSARIEIPSVVPLYMKTLVGTSSKKYFESKRLFIQESAAAYLNQSETFCRVSFGTPYKTTGRAILGLTYGVQTDEYSASTTTSSEVLLDETEHQLLGASLRFEKNTLNSVMYPSRGINVFLLNQAFSGKEEYFKNESGRLVSSGTQRYYWGQSRFCIKKYIANKRGISIGTLLDVTASNKNAFKNYPSTLLQAPAFSPTPHSKIVFNEKLRAFNYLAVGIMPLWSTESGFQIRTEFYGFLPYQEIQRDSENKAILGKKLNSFSYLGEASLVYNLPIASIGVFANRYSFPSNNWNWGINIGFLLYNAKLIE